MVKAIRDCAACLPPTAPDEIRVGLGTADGTRARLGLLILEPGTTP